MIQRKLHEIQTQAFYRELRKGERILHNKDLEVDKKEKQNKLKEI